MAIFGPQNSGAMSRGDAERKRELAKQLMGSGFRAVNPLGALANAIEGSVSGVYDREAGAAESAGNKTVSELLQNKDYTGAMGNEWSSPQQQAVASMLQGRDWQVGDRNAQWAREDQRLAQQQALRPAVDLSQTTDGRIELAKQFGLTGQDAQMYVLTGKLPGANDSAKFGFTPVPVVDDNGNYQLLQLGSDGKPVTVPLPEGYRYDPGAVPQDKAYGAELGKGIGGQALTAPGDISSANMAMGLIDQIKSSPELGWATGFTSAANAIPGTGRHDFQLLVDQAKGGAFLTAVQSMRGLGVLSDTEGRAATAAIARMDTSQTKEGFMKALDDYQKVVQIGAARAQARAGGNTAINPTGMSAAPGIAPMEAAPSAASPAGSPMGADPLGLF